MRRGRFGSDEIAILGAPGGDGPAHPGRFRVEVVLARDCLHKGFKNRFGSVHIKPEEKTRARVGEQNGIVGVKLEVAIAGFFGDPGSDEIAFVQETVAVEAGDRTHAGA